MKRVIFLLLCLACMTGAASAYGLYVACDEKVQAGIPIKCTIDSDFPEGTTFDLVFYQTKYTATELDRQPFTIQENQETLYKTFDTQGLPGGNYKIEVQYRGSDEPRLRTGSVTLQLVTVVDRSDEITITSPQTQDLDEALRIEGSIAREGNQGVKLEVRGPDGKVFGPDWIGTRNDIKSGAGMFTQKVTVYTPGEYDVSFTDTKGFIGTVTFIVTGPSATQAPATIPPTTAAATTQATQAPATVPTTGPVPPTQSPLNPLVPALALACVAFGAVMQVKRN